MALNAGTRIGSYEIVAPIGAGGMGEVYRARDLKLNREVALKILPEALAADPERLARFRREAQVLASLNHPNIGAIYGFEDSATRHALVLELVEGQTLAELISGTNRQGLVFDQVVSIAKQIANALEAAHEQGIIHRDLKPANIKIRSDGAVKVLDFGLAKALTADSGVRTSDFSNSPTVTSPATEFGVILGTAAYMAPEQATGRAVDKRADIWAFGVVLCEMLTGDSLFGRQTVTETFAAVLRDEPRLDRLPPETPPAIRLLIARCLERDPRQRLRDIGEARITLSQPVEPAALVAPAPKSRVALFVSRALILAALMGAAAWYFKPVPASPLRRFDLPESIVNSRDWALSPDGSRIAYLAGGHLYVQALDALGPEDLGMRGPGSRNVFWSFDSRAIGFVSEATIRTIPAAGGSDFVVCKIPASGRAMGVAWLPNNSIAFSVWRDSLYSVPATGGTPTVMLAIDPAVEIDFHSVTALPDGRLTIDTHERKADADVAELYDGNQRVRLSSEPGVSRFQYAGANRMLFLRVGRNAGLWTAPFTGRSVDLRNATLVQAGADGFDVASDGTLILSMPARLKLALVWVDRSGTPSPVPGAPVEVSDKWLALSPDGRRAAYIAGSGNTANLMVRDLETGVDTPLTFNKSDDASASWLEPMGPTWSPTGDRVLVGTGDVEAMRVMAYRADVASQPREVAAGIFGAISPDGRTFLVIVDDRGHTTLRKALLQADGAAGPLKPVFASGKDPDVKDFQWSPDGRLIAYTARQADGKMSVFLSAFPDATGQLLVAEGASSPRFSHDGELLYAMGTIDESGRPLGMLMSTAVTPGPTIKLGVPTMLFDNRKAPGLNIVSGAVSPDGRHFLMWKSVPPGPGESARMIVVLNWPASLRAK